MRFLSDGPSIPDDLLERRDRGDVVFFCGAGISRPAGLPGFGELAARVMKALGTPPEAKSRQLFEHSSLSPELDRVFNLLQQEYGCQSNSQDSEKRGYRAAFDCASTLAQHNQATASRYHELRHIVRTGRPNSRGARSARASGSRQHWFV